MKLTDQTVPLGHLSAHAPQMLRDLAETQRPVIILEDGMPRAVLQDIARYEATQETLALLKVLAITTQAINDGKVSPAADAFARRARKTFPPSSACDTLG